MIKALYLKVSLINTFSAQVPSPGRYDPKPDVNVKGAIMPTSKRFPGQSTTSSSLDNIEKASTASLRVVFRTVSLARKYLLNLHAYFIAPKTRLDKDFQAIVPSLRNVRFLGQGPKIKNLLFFM